MRLLPIVLATACAMSLAACNSGSGDQGASQRAVEEAGGSVDTMQRTPADGPPTTGAGGAVTGSQDPNPAGSGATRDATPGDATGSMGATSPTAPPSATPPTAPPSK
jgi:hypothetical protein